MSRTTLLTLKNIPLGDTAPLLLAPEVTAYCQKHNVTPKLTKNIMLAAVRVVSRMDKHELYFPIPSSHELDVLAPNTTEQTISLTYTNNHLALARQSHCRKFPNLFSVDKEVAWFNIGLQASVNLETGVMKSIVLRPLAYEHPQVQYAGESDSVESLDKAPPSMTQDIEQIVSGKVTIDIIAEIQFMQAPPKPPEEKKTDEIVTTRSMVIDKDENLVMIPVTVRGKLEFEVRQDTPYFGKVHEASFVQHDDALLYLDIKAVVRRAGFDVHHLSRVLHSPEFEAFVQRFKK